MAGNPGRMVLLDDPAFEVRLDDILLEAGPEAAVASISAEPGSRFVIQATESMTPEAVDRLFKVWEWFWRPGPVPKLLLLDRGMKLIKISSEIPSPEPDRAE